MRSAADGVNPTPGSETLVLLLGYLISLSKTVASKRSRFVLYVGALRGPRNVSATTETLCTIPCEVIDRSMDGFGVEPLLSSHDRA